MFLARSSKVLTTALLLCAGLCEWKSKYLLVRVALRYTSTSTFQSSFTVLFVSRKAMLLLPTVNGNIGTAEKQHAETTGHDIHSNYANILETGVKTKNKRLFLESLHSFLDKNSVNERAPSPGFTHHCFPPLGATNNDVFFYICAFRDLMSTFL